MNFNYNNSFDNYSTNEFEFSNPLDPYSVDEMSQSTFNDLSTEKENKALCSAIIGRRPKEVLKLLQSGANANYVYKETQDRKAFECSLLYYAIKTGQVKITYLLLQYGADPNHISKGTDKHGNVMRELSLVEYAIKQKQLKTIKLLLANGANPNYIVKERIRSEVAEFSLLHYAIYLNQMETVKMLLHYGANPDTASDNLFFNKFTTMEKPQIKPLKFAKLLGNKKIEDVILKHFSQKSRILVAPMFSSLKEFERDTGFKYDLFTGTRKPFEANVEENNWGFIPEQVKNKMKQQKVKPQPQDEYPESRKEFDERYGHIYKKTNRRYYQ